MKYIIFDFDGTIGDSQRLIVKTLQDTMRERELEVKSDEACAKTIGLRLDEAFVALFGMSAEEGEACAATYREIFMKNKEIMIVEPFPHVIETLRKLHQRGFVLGVASSRNHCSLDGYVRQMALDNIFTSIVAGDDVEHVKPAPDMVWRALKEMNGEIEEALVVGDMTFDVDMAHNERWLQGMRRDLWQRNPRATCLSRLDHRRFRRIAAENGFLNIESTFVYYPSPSTLQPLNPISLALSGPKVK